MSPSQAKPLSVRILQESNRASRLLIGKGIDVEETQAKIMDLAEAVNDRIDGRFDPRSIVAGLRKTFFGRGGFSYYGRGDSEPDIERLLLNRVLETRVGNCQSLSLLLLTVGEIAEVPLRAVVVPRHMIVRYDAGGAAINIDAERRGAHLDDEAYVRRYGTELRSCAFCLRNLEPDEVIATYQNSIARELLIAEEPEAAIRLLEEAVAACGDDPEAFNNLGCAYRQTGELDKAIDAHRRACELSPYSSGHHYNLGIAFYVSGHLSEAVESYTAALEINPHCVRSRVNRAYIYYAQGHADKAVPELKRALMTDRKDHDAHACLGLCYAAMGCHKKAVRAYGVALRLNPANEKVRKEIERLRAID